MSTITVWLLIALSSSVNSSSAIPATTIERFATVQECQRVLRVMADQRPSYQPMVCIQATVVKP